MKKYLLLFYSAILGTFLICPTVAADHNVYTRPDGSWISISGTVEDVRMDTFTLDYGHGLVTVEMDDGDRDADAYKLIKGDDVTVYGFIDDDLFETTKIEASSVYVDKLGTYFYASGIDEEDTLFSVEVPRIQSSVVIQGKVTRVNDTQFVLDYGNRSITVEVDDMNYNPLDDQGYLKVEIGDIVNVSGKIEAGFFDNRILEAESIIKIIS